MYVGSACYITNMGIASDSAGSLTTQYTVNAGALNLLPPTYSGDEASQTVACANQTSHNEQDTNLASPLQRTMVISFTGATGNGGHRGTAPSVNLSVGTNQMKKTSHSLLTAAVALALSLAGLAKGQSTGYIDVPGGPVEAINPSTGELLTPIDAEGSLGNVAVSPERLGALRSGKIRDIDA